MYCPLRLGVGFLQGGNETFFLQKPCNLHMTTMISNAACSPGEVLLWSLALSLSRWNRQYYPRLKSSNSMRQLLHNLEFDLNA